jgi:urea carboxylase
MNTRLQVEHGVTEEVMGIDLVEWMVRGGAGDFAFLDTAPTTPSGHSVQVRLYAEDPALDYRPTSGTLTAVTFPADIRAETWVMAGSEISAWYDPMLAKLIVHGPTRDAAVAAMQQALAATRVDGIETNLRWLRQVVASEAFTSGEVSTRVLDTIQFVPASLRVIAGGTATTVQDWPGRQHLWAVGVPPSGPMDDQSFRLGNRLLGNPEGMAGLEMTHTGPTLAFTAPARICLTGADFGATLDGVAVPLGQVVDVAAGQTLATGRTRGGGMRGYLLIAGGLDIAPYLGSRATFELGQFGGHAARRLVAGDVLHLGQQATADPLPAWPARDGHGMDPARALWPAWRARFLHRCRYRHGRRRRLAGALQFQPHRVRLIGPKPQWARADGGEAGLHPPTSTTIPMPSARWISPATCRSSWARMALAGRVRLPLRGDRGRSLEDRPARAR